MAKLDKLKEVLGVLKFWLGIVVATILALLGWAATNFDTESVWKLAICFAIAIALAFVAYKLQQAINQQLDKIEKEK